MTEQRVINSDALTALCKMNDFSIDCLITSPPYYNLRDYHNKATSYSDGTTGQLGQEADVDLYIKHLVQIFHEAHRVLKDTGACWVNLGDTYDKHGALYQVPARFALAMSADGWLLRNEIIWQKPNAMPQSSKTRFTIDFEKMFFFVKQPKYYFRQYLEALKCPNAVSDNASNKHALYGRATYSGWHYDASELKGRNKRCVWSIATHGSRTVHCAVFPEQLLDVPLHCCVPEHGTVLDCFAGAGTVLLYCKKHDINVIGIELNASYCELIKQTLSIKH